MGCSNLILVVSDDQTTANFEPWTEYLVAISANCCVFRSTQSRDHTTIGICIESREHTMINTWRKKKYPFLVYLHKLEMDVIDQNNQIM